jgi:HD-GYP domain-containing protein (c-di-GMP phosphodiesterase class II)
MHGTGRDESIRLAELVAAFSLASDLGLGQPMEHVLRSWLIASRLGQHFGLDDDGRQALFYVVTLSWVGCVADTPEVAAWFGDDIAFRHDSYRVDRVGLPMLGLALRRIGTGTSLPNRVRLGTKLLVTGGAAVSRGLLSHCLTTAKMAERFGLGSEVCNPLQQVFTRWDGKGMPTEVAGDGIDPTARLFHLADTVEVFHRNDGVKGALDIARARRGTHLDPGLVDAFCDSAGEVLADLEIVSDWDALIDAEPGLQTRLTGPDLDVALEAIADFTDLRSTFRTGHSRAVASLSAAAAEQAGLPPADVVNVHRAGLVHEIGLHGVPATIIDKPGPLTRQETERMRLHTYLTERMLAHTPALARIGAVAAMVHERLDGSGYHRGLSGSAIPAAGRVLATADAYQAMTEPRAHRPALTPKEASDTLRAEARAGRYSHDAVDAVLAAAGHRRGKRRSGPAGLTGREMEVLVLIARGASNRQVAHELGITPKTAGTHIERIYTKIGASTRSTAALFAMQHGLLDATEPSDL